MEDEVKFAPEMLHCLVGEVFQIGNRGGVSFDERSVALLCEFLDRSETYGHGRIGQYYFRTLLDGLNCRFPGYGLFVQCTENDAFLSFEYVM